MKTITKAGRSRPSKALRDRLNLSVPKDDHVNDQYGLSLFQTPLGWIGLLGQQDRVARVYLGHTTSASVQAAIQAEKRNVRREDWIPKLRRQLEAYAEGEVIDFSEVPLQVPATTAFRTHVIAATREIGYGETASYGDLACRVGHPGAARAVGTVMSTNRFPILIPCHRVLAAGGRIGGYTCPTGISMKQKLLELEARHSGRSQLETNSIWSWRQD